MRLKGILFDFDGVVIKSMEQHLEAWQYAYKKYKIHIKAEDFYHLEGRGVKEVVKDLSEKYGIDPKLGSQIMQTKIDYYEKILTVEFYDGFFPLLDFLRKQNIKMAIVTGSMRFRVQSFIDKYLNGYIDALVSADDVTNTKPFPEPFLKGAEFLGLEPKECLIIENAPMGIKAGKAAQMKVIAIQTTLGKEYLHEADFIVTSFDEIKSLLQNLFA